MTTHTPVAPVRRREDSVWARVLDVAHLRLLGASIFFGLVLAVVTGPAGSASAPTSGFTASLGFPRVLWFIGFGLALFAVRTVAGLFGTAISAWLRKIRALVAQWLTATRVRVLLELALIGFGFIYVSWLTPHDTWKGGLCIQVGVALLALEVGLSLQRRGARRGARLVAYAVIAAYGGLAILTGPVARYLDRISVVLHNPTFGKVLLKLVVLFVAIELVIAVAGFVQARVPRRRVRTGCSIAGYALVAYGWFTWTTWTQWDPNAPKSVAHWLSSHHLLVHDQTGGLVVMAIGALVLLAVAGWLAVDLRARSGTAPTPASPAALSIRTTAQRTIATPALIVFFALLALEWPLHMDPASVSNIDTQIMPFVLLTLGLNVVIGFAGLLDLGYVAFYAIGAYTCAYFVGALTPQPPFQVDAFWVIALSIVAAMLAGVLLGTPTLRLRGDYLAIVTLGFGEIIYDFANNNFQNISGGPAGAPGTIPNFNFHLLSPLLKGSEVWTPISYIPFYYLILGVVVLSMLAFRALEHSKVGRSWVAIREDEAAADSLGINALKYKVMAFAIGASTGGMAGVFLVTQNGTLFPTDFTLQFSITVVVCVVFGGMGSIPGAVVGAFVILGLPAYLQQHNFSFYQPTDFTLYLGTLLVVMMIFRPQGLIPSRRRRTEFALAEAGVERPMTDTDAEMWTERYANQDLLTGPGPVSAETQ